MLSVQPVQVTVLQKVNVTNDSFERSDNRKIHSPHQASHQNVNQAPQQQISNMQLPEVHQQRPSIEPQHQAQGQTVPVSQSMPQNHQNFMSAQDSQFDFSNFQYDSYASNNTNMFQTNASRSPTLQPSHLASEFTDVHVASRAQMNPGHGMQPENSIIDPMNIHTPVRHQVPQDIPQKPAPSAHHQNLQTQIPGTHLNVMSPPCSQQISNQGSPAKQAQGQASFDFQQKSPQSESKNAGQASGFEDFQNVYSSVQHQEPPQKAPAPAPVAPVQTSDPFGGFNFNFGNEAPQQASQTTANFGNVDFFGGGQQTGQTDVFEFKPKKQSQKVNMEVNFNDFFGGQAPKAQQPSNSIGFDFADPVSQKKVPQLQEYPVSTAMDFKFGTNFNTNPQPNTAPVAQNSNFIGFDLSNFGAAEGIIGAQQQVQPTINAPQVSKPLSNSSDKYSAFDDLLSSGQGNFLGPTIAQNTGFGTNKANFTEGNQGNNFAQGFGMTSQSGQQGMPQGNLNLSLAQIPVQRPPPTSFNGLDDLL